MVKKIIKFIYQAIPLKKYLFLIIRKIYSPKKNFYQHLTFEGIFKVKTENSEFKLYHSGTLIENQLFWRGLSGFEPNSLRIWSKLCKTSKVILDLGANTGVYSLLAKAENPHAIVHAFEPVERVFKLLEKNKSINNYDFTCHRKAVSNSDGKGFFFDDNEKHTFSVIVNLDRSNESDLHKVETETISLDSFVKENSIKRIDLIKVDVETHEPEVLKGFKEYLEKFRPTFILEIIKDEVANSLEKKLLPLDYLYFYINEPFAGADHRVKGPAYIKVKSLVGCKHGNYLICSQKKAIELNLT